MAFPLVPLIDFANALICIFASIKLYLSYKKDPHSPVLLFFSQAYAASIVSYLFFSLPRVFFGDNNQLVGYGFIVAQVFLYITVAFFSKVSMYFVNIQRMRLVFWLVMAMALIGSILNVSFYTEPFYDSSTSLTAWNIHPVVSYTSLVIVGGVLVLNMIFFFWQSIRTKDHLVRVRSLIIATGLLFLLITAYTYYEAITPLGVLVSDLFSLMSFLVIFFGIIYGRDHPSLPQSFAQQQYE